MRARLRMQVQAQVPRSVPVPVPPQASETTHTGWDGASGQVREAERRRALGGARRESTIGVERLERLVVPPG